MPAYQSAAKKQAGAGCPPTGPWALLRRSEECKGGGTSYAVPSLPPSLLHFSVSISSGDMCGESVGPWVPLTAKDTVILSS